MSDHGPIVRVFFHIVSAHPDENGIHFNHYQHQECVVEFKDNSATATEDLPTYNHNGIVALFTGHEHMQPTPQLPVYCTPHGQEKKRWCYFEKITNPHGDRRKWSGCAMPPGHGDRLVIIESLGLINPGTWEPTLEELEFFCFYHVDVADDATLRSIQPQSLLHAKLEPLSDDDMPPLVPASSSGSGKEPSPKKTRKGKKGRGRR
jgi:hypothetical protein